MKFILALSLLLLVSSGFTQDVNPKAGQSTNLASIDSDDFDIIFSQNLENTPVGPLSREQWAEDWQDPVFANGVYNGDYTIIEDADIGGRKSRVMRWIFPEGTYGANAEHGYQWQTPLGGSFEEIYLTYSIMFRPGFDPVLGGKIPGLHGGPKEIGPPKWGDGFGGSLMFKQGPKPVFYTYHHDMPLQVGETIGWGYTFDVSADIWYDITFRVVMNTATASEIGGPDGLNDGIMEGYVNGKLYGTWTNLRLRNLKDIGVDHARIQAFFGGGSTDWAPVRDEWMLIDNVFVWKYSNEYLEENPSVKRGRQANPWHGEILTPIDADFSDGVIPGPGDYEPPSIPTALHAIDTTESSVSISWDASEDNVGVTGYKVFMDGIAMAAAIETEYTITSLEPGKEYAFAVSSVDKEKNESPRSTSIYVTTLDSDREAPTSPSGISISDITGYTMLLSWQASDDNVGVEKYSIYRDDQWISDETSTSYKVTGLQPNTEYALALRAFDEAGNSSPLSSSVLGTTADPDFEPPSVPTGLIETGITKNMISIEWTPSTDNIGVREYYIYVNNELREKSSQARETIAQLASGFNYTISVSAVDDALNESPKSSEINISTVNVDETTLPVLPTVDITTIQDKTIKPYSTSEIGSFGHADLINYGIEVKQEDYHLNDPIILEGVNVSDGLIGNRIIDGLLALYNFSEGEGDNVEDRSNFGSPMNLKIKQEGVATQWLLGQGLRVIGNTIIEYEGSPDKLIDEFSRTNELTMEAWVRQDLIDQSGPARIMTLSEGNEQRAVTLGHEGGNSLFNYVARLNTSNSGTNGLPQLSTQEGFYNESLHHVIYTRHIDGSEEIYVNGVKSASGIKTGDFASWGDAHRFALGNELSLERPWKGVFYLAAVYNRAFSEDDVLTNYNAGIGLIQYSIPLDTLLPNVEYNLTPFVSTNQGVVYGDAKDFIYENVTEVDMALTFYPNPTNGSFSVIVRNDNMDLDQAYLRIADLSGRIHYNTELDLSEEILENEFTIDLPSSMENGIYALILIAGSTSVAQKLVLVR